MGAQQGFQWGALYPEKNVSGSFDVAVSLVVGCPVGAVLVHARHISGRINGQFEFRSESRPCCPR